MQHTVASCASLLLGTYMCSTVGLMSVGLDSISATELMRAISEELGWSIPSVALFDHPTLESLGAYLVKEASRTMDSSRCCPLCFDEEVSACCRGEVAGPQAGSLVDVVGVYIAALSFEVAGPTNRESRL